MKATPNATRSPHLSNPSSAKTAMNVKQHAPIRIPVARLRMCSRFCKDSLALRRAASAAPSCKGIAALPPVQRTLVQAFLDGFHFLHKGFNLADRIGVERTCMVEGAPEVP